MDSPEAKTTDNEHQTTTSSVEQQASLLLAEASLHHDSFSDEQSHRIALLEASEHAEPQDENPSWNKRNASLSELDNDNSNSNGSNSKRARQRRPPTRVPWEDRLEMLRDYKREHGDLLIPIRYKKNPSLGKFVHNMREQYKLFHKRTPANYKKKCSLTDFRIQQLNDIGFVWNTDRVKRQNEDWDSRFQQLLEYKKKHGHCLVPHGYEQDPAFAEWIHRQRTTYASTAKEEEPNAIIQERIKKLDSIGFNFTVHADKWMKYWALLKEYKEKHGDCKVPTHYSSNPRLGRWVHTQRHQRRLMEKGKKSCMTEERIQKLDELGFSWEIRASVDEPRQAWQQRYCELEAFYQANGHTRINASTHPGLYAWCLEQKQRLKHLRQSDEPDASKQIPDERVAKLEQLGFTADAELGLALEFGVDPPILEGTLSDGRISSTEI